MNKDSFWRKIIKSFRPSYYKELSFSPASEAIRYLFLLVLITSVIIGTYNIFNFKVKTLNFLRDNEAQIHKIAREAIVPLSIKKGKVTTTVRQPYVKTIKEYDSKEVVVIIDTTGKITSLDKEEEGLLITEDTLIIQTIMRDAVDIKKYNLSRIEDLSIKPSTKEGEYLIAFVGKRTYHITHDLLKKWVGILFRAGWPILLVFGYIFTLAAKFIQILIFSVFLLILNLTSIKKLNYPNIFNIGAYAMTPPTILAILHAVSGIHLRYFNIIYIVIYIIYLALGYAHTKENLPDIEDGE